MKHLLTTTALTNVATAMAALVLVAACQTVATNDAELAASEKFSLQWAGNRKDATAGFVAYETKGL